MQDFIGLSEIAELANATPQTVNNWKKRYADFPLPVAKIKAGEFYDKETIVNWLRKRGKIVGAKTVAFINLKGGVAKTTTTVGLATLLAGDFGKKVLVIDLDPQTNCTTMLIGEEKWKELNIQGHTLYTLFKDALDETSNFDIRKALQKKVSSIRDVTTLDLLPSSLDMVDLQDRIASAPQGRFFANNPTEIIKRAVKNVKTEYDYILIDCPPNMGLITLNGLRIADGYIIPTIPDVLSTYGIPQIINRVTKFSETTGDDIECLGIVATKVRAQSALHRRTLRTLEQEKDAPLFKTVFNENTQMGEAAEFQSVNTLRQKWGYQGQYDLFRNFAREVIRKMEA